MKREKFLYKKECKRSKKERMFRDIACYSVTIFAALMGFLLVEANANLADAESDYADTAVEMSQSMN